MVNVYQKHYGPMKNRLAKVNLESALVAIWSYSMHLRDGFELPAELRPPPPSKLSYFQQSQLVALGREVVMHCSRVGGQAFTYSTFASAMNSINDISNDLVGIMLASDEDSVLRSLDVMLHQQYPLQQPINIPQLLRYARIFGDNAISPMVLAKIGFDYEQCCFFLIALMGSLIRNPQILGSQRYDDFNIPPEACVALFKWVSEPLNDLSLKMKKQSVLDVNWASRWNSLGTKPLVQHDFRYPERMYCPVPDLLWQLMGQGMYYSLYNHPGFDHAFGTAFEEHVSEFAEFHLPTPEFSIFREQPFSFGKILLDGADLMICDDSGTLVLECKTKRMNVGSKQFDAGSILQDDLKVLSKAIVQLYKNIAHIRVPGRTYWIPRNYNFYPVIVTLEDWFLFSPIIWKDLKLLVNEHLAEAGLPLDLVETMPYTVVSSDECEQMLLAIGQESVSGIMGGKIKLECREVMMKAYLAQHHRDALNEVRGAYDGKFDRFHQQMTSSWLPAIRGDEEPLLN